MKTMIWAQFRAWGRISLADDPQLVCDFRSYSLLLFSTCSYAPFNFPITKPLLLNVTLKKAK